MSASASVAERVARIERTVAASVVPLLRNAPADARQSAATHDLPMPSPTEERIATVERDAFARGYAQGEQAGLESARSGTDAALRHLEQAIDEVSGLRSTMLQQSEQDVVRLAVAIAELIIRREIRADRAVLLQMAQAALARSGATPLGSIVMNPDDLEVITKSRPGAFTSGPLRLVADAELAPGACQVRAPLGFIDCSVDAQIRELLAALLDDEGSRD